MRQRGDVVVVSINHRLNVLGFTSLAELGGKDYAQSGTAGMLDIVHALTWVKANIAQFGGDKTRFSPAVTEGLERYSWPGNVRELKAMIELAVVMSDGKEIKADDINFPTTRNDEVYTAVEKPLREYTKDIIKFYLRKYDNDVLLVADKLDIGKSTIYKMIQNKEIEI